MYTGFATENVPGVAVYNLSLGTASGSVSRIQLESDCPPVNVFLTGGSSGNTITIYLPTVCVPGKTITLKNDRLNTGQGTFASGQLISVIDPTTGNSICGLGQSQTVTLVYCPQLQNTVPGAIGPVKTCWVNLTGASAFANNNGSIVFGSSNTSNIWSTFIAGGDNNSATSNGNGAICAGNNNTISGGYNFIGGGQSNNASGSNAGIIGGTSNSAAGISASVLGGNTNSAQGTNSSIIGGNNNGANGNNSVILGGGYGSARLLSGYVVIPGSSSPIATVGGTTQTSILNIARQTTDATVTTLASNSSAPGTNNQLVLPNNSAYYVRGSCIATVTGGGNTKAWSFEVAIKRGASAATTAIVGAVIKNVVAADAGAATWDITIDADTTNGCLRVRATGQAATTIRWVCSLNSTEVTY